MRRRLRFAATVVCLPLFLALGGTAPFAVADTFKPTRLDDPLPGKCKPKNCSLREAMAAANVRAGPDKVLLGRGTYEIKRSDSGDDDGDLDVTGPVVIRGRGNGKTRVDGNDDERLFHFSSPRGRQLLSALTVKRGGDVPFGGGVLADGTSNEGLILKGVAVRSSSAGTGGGIYAFDGPLTVIRSTISRNSATYGGGIAVANGSVGRNVEIRSTTLSANLAEVGGGLFADGTESPGPSHVPLVRTLNSTFAGNQASVSGGGVSAIQHAAVLLDNTTIAYNRADSDNAAGGAGGGLHQSTIADLHVVDSVVAANTVGSSGEGPQCAGQLGAGGDVIEAPAGPCEISTGYGPNKLVQDALIGPLLDNGGSTETIALQPGSPALDAAQDECPAKDQRGKRRPAVGCDSGAFERNPINEGTTQ